jgi:ribonuclease HI
VSDKEQPVTLLELLRALARSRDLRPLARDCGLSVRELRRRLTGWSREMEAELNGEASPPEESGAAGDVPPAAPPRGRGKDWPELPAADELDRSPLPRKGSRVLEAWTDGASKGNPGPAGIGVVFRQQGGPELCTHREAIGTATNNVAEYQAVLRALEHCRRWRIARLDLFLDSELIARQLTGAYRVKSPGLRPLYQQAVHLARGLKEFRVRHVPRGRNAHADHLANRALAERGRSAS